MPGLATARDVALTAGDSDPLTPWIDQFNIASHNATTLLNTFAEAPFVGTQQMIANMSGWVQDLLNDPANSNAVVTQMQDDLAAVVKGYTLQGADSGTTATVLAHTLEGSEYLGGRVWVFNNISSYLPPSVPVAEVTPIINFLASPLSGIIIGALGPEISPWVALMNSANAGDDWNTTLANMVGAYFNGATLNLNGLIPAIDEAKIFPAGMNLMNLDVAFGGLLTPGSVGPEGDGVGGSIFNSLGLTLTGLPVIGKIDLTATPVGPLGALEGWGQTIAALLGWDGSGPPLGGVTLPLIPTDLFDVGGASASDFSAFVQDVLSLF